jgi:hypothetical protein
MQPDKLLRRAPLFAADAKRHVAKIQIQKSKEVRTT